MIKCLFFTFIIVFIIINNLYLKEHLENNNNIALISTYNHHYECVGFLLEYYNNHNIDVYHTSNEYKEGYLDYFKKIYKFNTYNIHNIKLDENKYSKIIKLTSNDSYPIENKNKLISIIHLKTHSTDNFKKNIIISPLVKVKYNTTYILPIYKGLLSKTRKNTICYIGDSTFWLEFNNFINNINYKIIILTRDENIIYKHPNVEFKYKYKTIDMINVINKSSFILIRKSKDRFTGAITLALSHNIPMLIDEYQAKIYKFPAITYKKSPNELIDKINNLSVDKYNKFKQELKSFSNDTINNYKNIDL